jgi:hypothetical protein
LVTIAVVVVVTIVARRALNKQLDKQALADSEEAVAKIDSQNSK